MASRINTTTAVAVKNWRPPPVERYNGDPVPVSAIKSRGQ